MLVRLLTRGVNSHLMASVSARLPLSGNEEPAGASSCWPTVVFQQTQTEDRQITDRLLTIESGASS